MEIVIIKQAKKELRSAPKVADAIYVLHASEKKKQEIDKRTTELIKTRMRSIGL